MQENENNFKDLGVNEQLLQALEDLKFNHPTEIQIKSIPLLLQRNSDFVGQAQTGTGKTAAFGIPLLQSLKPAGNKPQALVLAPTRELALQISDELFKFAKYQRVDKINLCGGMSYQPQLAALKSGKLQLVIGTPGRVIDMIDRGALDLSAIDTIVLDEADEMLNMGFWDDVNKIIDQAGEQRRLWMFSATVPKPIGKLIEKSFRQPCFVKTDRKELSNSDIAQSYYLVKDKYKLNALTQVLDLIDDFYGVIFCETRQQTKDLGLALMDLNYNISILHGDLSQTERMSAMRDFKKRKTRVLICTDVAARGIDVDDLSHVINYGLPRDKESYVHRIGRTGRAGKKGIAISILNREDWNRLQRIERLQEKSIQRAHLPNLAERKRIYLEKRTKRFDALMEHLRNDQESGGSYYVDPVFAEFAKRFADLSKEDSLKLIFNAWFKNDLRRMEELEDIELDLQPSGRKSQAGASSRSGQRSARQTSFVPSRRASKDSKPHSRRSSPGEDGFGPAKKERKSSAWGKTKAEGARDGSRSKRGSDTVSSDRSSRKKSIDSSWFAKDRKRQGAERVDSSSMFFTPNQKKQRKQELQQKRSR